MKRELVELKKAEQELNQVATDVKDSAVSQKAAEQTYEQTLIQKTSQIRTAENEYDSKKREEFAKAEEEKARIQAETDAQRIVVEKLRESVLKLPIFKANAAGRLEFDEREAMNVLEDILLDDIIDDIEKQDGKKGFMTKTKRAYDTLLSHWDTLEDLSELPEVDYIQSTILSRTKGYKLPTFPYLIVAKYSSESQGNAKVQVDTAIVIDKSGSMDTNGRLEAARKTGMATQALMRRLNPNNDTYLAYFSDNVEPIAAVDILRSVTSSGGTATEEALQWILDTLGNKKMSIGYLISDGDPNRLDATIEAARKFRDYPNVLLRIFLIDGSQSTEDNIRRIGKAAGPSTRVVPVKNYELTNGVIRDISKSIGKLYDVANF